MNAVSESSAPPQAASQRREAYAPLADFSLALIQAMLRTGYYAPDHPEAKKSLSGLYEQFAALVEGQSELTFMLVEKPEEREITIEGYAAVPLPMHQVMIKGMADLFTPKFIEFFKRWNLLSFSIKSDTSADDFHTFIELMSQPPVGAGKLPSERLTQALVDHQIMHISTVFNHEMVGRERRLPWRVRMALTRLRRDLRLLPMYKKATVEQIRRIKLQIIEDVIRPIRTPILLKDFLVNYDLVAADIRELDESAVEREIVANLSEEMLVTTAREIIRDLKQPGDKAAHAAAQDESFDKIGRCVYVLRDIADQLCAIGSVLDHDFLEALVSQKVLPLEKLPAEVRRAVETRRLAEGFVARKTEYLAALRQVPNAETAKKLAALVYRITPDLLRRSKYETVGEILDAVNQGRQTPRTARFFEQLAGILAQGLADQATIGYLLGDLRRQSKEQRNRLVQVFAFVGQPVAEGLLTVYIESDDQAVRASAFEALLKIGRSALQPFLTQLPQIESEWPAVRHILNEVGELGDEALAKPLTGFLYHANAHVRHAALTALFKLQGDKAEEYFLQALRDREVEVRQAAVSHLAGIGSRHPQALHYYASVLNPTDHPAAAESDAVLIEVCRALAGLASTAGEDVERAREILLAALVPIQPQGVLGRFKKPAPRHSEPVQAAIREALAALGEGGDAAESAADL
jgi:HEAT repeat protein